MPKGGRKRCTSLDGSGGSGSNFSPRPQPIAITKSLARNGTSEPSRAATAQRTRTFPNMHAHVVAQRKAQKYGLQRMISVGFLTEDAQREIDFRLGKGPARSETHAGSTDGCRSRSRTPSRVKYQAPMTV